MSDKKKKVLIADDDSGILDALTIMLEDGGYAVETTTDGSAAENFALLRRMPLSLIKKSTPKASLKGKTLLDSIERCLFGKKSYSKANMIAIRNSKDLCYYRGKGLLYA